jgi:hypothetical protein
MRLLNFSTLNYKKQNDYSTSVMVTGSTWYVLAAGNSWAPHLREEKQNCLMRLTVAFSDRNG